MAKFKAFWNYQKKKTGEIVIAEEELQEMLDACMGCRLQSGKSRDCSFTHYSTKYSTSSDLYKFRSISIQYPWI
ncbi:MAG: hypothetical protein ACLTX3_07795 [Lachnospiraceae bacterium]